MAISLLNHVPSEYTHPFVANLDRALSVVNLVLVAISDHLELSEDHNSLIVEADDAHWRSDFATLARGARLILLAPEATRGR